MYIDDTIRELETVKQEKPDKRIIVGGHSMGGLISIMVALKRPDLVNGLVLSAPLLKVCICLIWLIFNIKSYTY